jgi:ABC-2 type transport system permease protein
MALDENTVKFRRYFCLFSQKLRTKKGKTVSGHFSWSRLLAVIIKEFLQMRRDRLTFAIMIIIPIIQLTLFGFAINTNPKYLPTGLLAADNSIYVRSFVQALVNTEYFRITRQVKSESEGARLLAEGDILFLITVPTDFTRKLIRQEDNPSILIEADDTDPVAVAYALAAIPEAARSAFNRELSGGTGYLANSTPNYQIVIHPLYNPERKSQFNVVPGLLGVVLTMTMVMITSLAITRERERGTMENLLATPVRPIEVMLGKITPYILVGYIQITFILLAAIFLFEIPIEGSIFLFLFCALPFIAANLSVGLTFSSIAKNQLQAMQMAFFFFLPSILLSGFIFPFKGMPQWAQYLGQILPLSHFIRIARGILLKGNTLDLIWMELWPIVLFVIIALMIGILRYQRTLD